MNKTDDLIKINYDTDQPTVSARDLYERLRIKSNFTTWFDRMTEYGFTEGADYTLKWSDSKNGNAVVFEKSPQYMTAKGFSMDADVSIDTAKQICRLPGTRIFKIQNAQLC